MALNGDPREAGAAFAAVMAASLANGGSADDIMPGIQYFADLKKSGNLIATDVTQATVLSGETPIALDWSYNFPGLAKQVDDAGFTVEVNFPSDGVYGGYYAQGVVKGSPHPNLPQAVDRAHPVRRGRPRLPRGRRHPGPLRRRWRRPAR